MVGSVTITGPLFDGRAIRAVDPMMAGVVRELTARGNEIIDDLLQASIRQPSSPPFYQARVLHETRANTGVIHDSGVIYGPWLEGISSRNRSTRFKGYSSFRRGAQRVQQEASRRMGAALKRWAATYG